jgi:serine/threonine-protein kinase
MTAERWERIQSVFHSALERPEAERRAYVESACAGDPTLVPDVIAMLEEDSRSASLLDRDVANVAHELLKQTAGAVLERIGPYRIERILGEGGMGIVYFARRDDIGSVAAIKLLRDAWMSPARRERFATEQRTLAQLYHPSIARLYDAGATSGGTPWFAMEYVEGAPLTDYCNRQHASLPERLRLFRSACEAVEYAHRHAIIHRDLKPSNILVNDNGQVKLLDFGIAKQLDADDSTAARTRTGLRLMTPAYAAPEQIRGENLGVHTDVYALGVLLYELLAGRLPFAPKSQAPGELERMVLETEPEKPSAAAQHSKAAKSTWADLDVLCLTAMHKDPERRYRSVEALIRDLDHFLKGEPLEARPDRFSYRAAKFLRRNRAPVVISTTVALAVFAMIVFFTLNLSRARNAAVAEAARTQRIQRFMLNLFDAGDAAAGPAGDLKVVELLDRGVQEAKALDREPLVQAELYRTLGGIYKKLGKFEQADSLLRLALDQRRDILGNSHGDVARSTVDLGLLRVDQAKLEDAEKLVRDGLEKARQVLRPGDPVIAEATLALGRVLDAQGAYDKAIPVLEEALKLAEAQGRDTAQAAESLVALSSAHFYLGHHDICDALNHRALDLHRRLNGERHPLRPMVGFGTPEDSHQIASMYSSYCTRRSPLDWPRGTRMTSWCGMGNSARPPRALNSR